jgi:hypothetical protein
MRDCLLFLQSDREQQDGREVVFVQFQLFRVRRRLASLVETPSVRLELWRREVHGRQEPLQDCTV